MEKSDIQNRVKEMKSLADFVELLNDIRYDEFGTTKHQITEAQLLHFCNNRVATKRFKTFKISKKSGGFREINAPCRQLSHILYIINIVFKSLFSPKPCVTGFAEGRSIVMNASKHVGHHYVFNIDLKDFFPSIPQARVWKRIQVPPFNFLPEIANVVAGLCCTTNEEGTMNVLPQGAATSPLLTNAICDRLDWKMMGVAKRFGLHYSRYADDMTFSSMHNVYQEGSEFRQEIKKIVEEEGFRINDKKTRLLRDGQRQEVTGLTVNENVNVTKKYVRDLRCLLHVWETKGYAQAYAYFYPLYKRDKGYIKKGEPIMENVIEGKLNYLRMVKGEGNEAYKKLLARFNRLQSVVFVDNETDKDKSYTYVCTYSMKDFEEKFKTQVSLMISSRKNLVGKCIIAGMDKTLRISNSTKNYLCPNHTSLEAEVQVESKKLSDCFVNLCRDKGENFWLITKAEMKRSRCLSILNANININALLDIWEKEGIEKAAKKFKEMISSSDDRTSQGEKQEKPRKKTGMADGIPKDILEAIKKSYFDVTKEDKHEYEEGGHQ